jgi:hypothetical protein
MNLTIAGWTLTQRNENLTIAGGELRHRGMTTWLWPGLNSEAPCYDAPYALKLSLFFYFCYVFLALVFVCLFVFFLLICFCFCFLFCFCLSPFFHYFTVILDVLSSSLLINMCNGFFHIKNFFLFKFNQ